MTLGGGLIVVTSPLLKPDEVRQLGDRVAVGWRAAIDLHFAIVRENVLAEIRKAIAPDFEAIRRRHDAARDPFGCDHPGFDGIGVCTCCKEFYSAAHDRGAA